jgi:2-isopropylmalate synthase
LLPERVAIYDTTLRDGTQREGISLSVDDKLRIARRLDALGVSFIEAGWPGSNPKDAELFARAKDEQWHTAKLTAFGATGRVGKPVEDDPSLNALLTAGTEAVALFGKSSLRHVREVLRTTDAENLRVIEESVRFLRERNVRVIYDAEHFFDGFEEDQDYALETLRAAARGGAEVLVLCDTNGGTLPWRVEEVVRAAAAVGRSLGIHTHNDGECAVANALAAVRAGAVQVQGTINGYGERCGNANLCALIPDLELKLKVRCLPDGGLKQLHEVAHFVAEVANIAADEHMAYVGRSAFAHKGGVHVAAMRRSLGSYEHVDPEAVGNRSRFVVSELAGRATILGKAEELGVQLGVGDEVAVLNALKDAEAAGHAFEAAEASVALRVRRRDKGYRPPFEPVDYRVISGEQTGDRAFSDATVKVRVDGQVFFTAAGGNGPVSALDAALRKALAPMFPLVERIKLVDYKVRILDGGRGTSATVRVLIDSSDGERRWATVGAGTNIIAASWQALVESIEFGLGPAAPKAHAARGSNLTNHGFSEELKQKEIA